MDKRRVNGIADEQRHGATLARAVPRVRLHGQTPRAASIRQHDSAAFAHATHPPMLSCNQPFMTALKL